MKVAERMRRDGWARLFGPLAPVWVKDGMYVSLAPWHAWISGGDGHYERWDDETGDGMMPGLRDLAQRAKAAARKLARKRRTQ